MWLMVGGVQKSFGMKWWFGNREGVELVDC